MLMPMFSGDLRDSIDAKMRNLPCACGADCAPFSDVVAFWIILQVALGMKNLHDIGIYHRDLKAANILVDMHRARCGHELAGIYNCYIADFEDSEYVKGTAFWRAPEVLLSLRTKIPLTANQWRAADVYSFGMTCYEVFTGEIPFRGHKYCDYDIVLDGGRPELPDYVPEPMKDFIRKCWHPDPDCRPDFGDIVQALKEVDNYGFLSKWTIGAETLRTIWELPSGGANDQSLLRLQELTQRHYDTHLVTADHFNQGFWARRFVADVEQFVSEFGWNSYLTRPALPFAEYVRRRTLDALMTGNFVEFSTTVICESRPFFQNSDKDMRPFLLERGELCILAKKMYQAITEGSAQSRFEDTDNILTLKEKLKLLDGFVIDIKDAISEDSALFAIKGILKRMDPAGTNIEIARFHLHMKFIIRRHTFLKNYGIPLRLVIGSIVLYLIYKSSYCNYILFRMFGIVLSDFYEVFLGLFCPLLEGPGIGTLQYHIPRWGQFLSLLRGIFSFLTFCLAVRSYGFLRYLSWLLVYIGSSFYIDVVSFVLFTLHEYLYLMLSLITSFFFGRRMKIRGE